MPRNRTCYLPYESKMYQCAKIAEPIPAAIKTGFVNLFLIQGQRQITVGNQSSPYFNNRIYISSMSYGGSSMPALTMKIVDTSGNDFNVFVNSLYKGSCESVLDDYALVEFGWIVTRVDGHVDVVSTANNDMVPYLDVDIEGFRAPNGLFTFRLGKIDVVSEAAGCWVYNLEFGTAIEFEGSQKIGVPIGTDDNKVPLKDVGKQIFDKGCEDNIPKNNGDVFFFRNEETHFSPYGFLNSEGGTQGPRSVWDASRKNPIAAMRNWMNSVTTDRRLGTNFYTDPTIMKPNLIALEGWDLSCQQGGQLCQDADKPPALIYLVNAGDCTPVIDFKPQVEWNLADSDMQGGGSSAISGQTVQVEACIPRGNNKQNNNSNTGVQAQVMVPQSNLNFRSPDSALKSETFALGANFVANTDILTAKSVTATLTIEGDPRWALTTLAQGLFIGVIYFNNPAVRSFTNKNEYATCDWLAYPVVNNIFSSVQYMVTGVSHSIDESGNYTTELSLMSNIAENLDGSKQVA